VTLELITAFAGFTRLANRTSGKQTCERVRLPNSARLWLALDRRRDMLCLFAVALSSQRLVRNSRREHVARFHCVRVRNVFAGL